MEGSWLRRNGTRDQTEAQARVASWSRHWTGSQNGNRGVKYPGTHPSTHSGKEWRKKVYPGPLSNAPAFTARHWSNGTRQVVRAKQSSSTALFMNLSYPSTLQHWSLQLRTRYSDINFGKA